MAAIVISAAGGNWNASASWSPAQVPVAGDTVTAATASGNLTINVTSSCASIILTSYARTLTFNAPLTVTSTVTLATGMTVSGTSSLIPTGSATLTSAGQVFSGTLDLRGTSQTYTMDNWNVNSLIVSNAVTSITINTGSVMTRTDFIANTTGSILTVNGTSTVIFAGTGKFQFYAYINLNINFNTSGTITLFGSSGAAGGGGYFGGSMSWTGGTIVTTGFLLELGTATNNPTMNIGSGVTFEQITLQAQFSPGNTTTLTNDLYCGILKSYGAIAYTGGNGYILNGASFKLYASKSFTPFVSSNTSNTGTSTLVLTGGTWSGMNGEIRHNMTLAGTVSISGTVDFTGATMTYTSGPITTAGSTLRIGYVTSGQITTLNTGNTGMSWNNISLRNTNTINLTGIVNCNGDFTSSGGNYVLNGSSFYLAVGGSFTPYANSVNIGNAQWLVLNGTGTWSCTNAETGHNLLLATLGTINISGVVDFTGAQLKWQSGTIAADGTLRIGYATNNTTTTINTAGMSWNDISSVNTNTISLSSALSAAGTIYCNVGTASFSGVSGFSTSGLYCTQSGLNIILASNQTYTVSNALTLVGASASHIAIKSNTPSTKAILTCSVTIPNYVVYVDATDIDSSVGSVVYDFKGTLLRTYNWVGLPKKTVSF